MSQLVHLSPTWFVYFQLEPFHYLLKEPLTFPQQSFYDAKFVFEHVSREGVERAEPQDIIGEMNRTVNVK